MKWFTLDELTHSDTAIAIGIDNTPTEEAKKNLTQLVDKILESEDGIFKGVTIKDLLPFLDDELIVKAFKKDLERNKDITIYLPFLDDDYYDEIVRKMLEENKIDDRFYTYLPFLSEEILSNVVEYYLNNDIELDLNRIYPFLSDEDIRKILKKSILD